VDIYTTIMSLLNVVMTLATGVASDASTTLFGADHTLLSFSVQSATQCTSKTCPGSFYTAITTAWANIGYVTHADVLRFINTSHFGKWAIILYIAAAIGGLLGVATNSPMRNYTWFFIGPALFSFLVGTPMKVQGVNWVVANRAVGDMSEVWRNAEAGLANTRLVKDGILKIKGKYGPQAQYEVAMPMVFLDELFSATSNILIEWTGIGRQVDNGGGESNLSNKQASGSKDAWWLLANLKWSYVENITASSIRNPDVRDAFVTFLASECGDLFKQGIDSGAYIAATQARGATPIETVFNNNDGQDYQTMQNLLGGTSIPTPRSLGRLFKEKSGGPAGGTGSFLNFSQSLKDKPREAGRGYGIVCSEYLWTIIQALRFEAGSAYYQMLRSAPDGFDEEGFVTTLLYGWDVREKLGEDIQEVHQKAFLKHLILAYIVRNELISAPQMTTVDQRYAPAEQARSYSEANIRSFGSKGKFIELYNAAVMMPYLQGILAYFLIMAYPIACMMVILPGHYKAFFTWVSFFAWIKLWDVGFAMVHVIERGVWAMIGNNSYMAATANTLIEVAGKVGGIGVEKPSTTFVGPMLPGQQGAAAMARMDAIPQVCSLSAGTVDASKCSDRVDQGIDKAFELFDKLLLVGANIDLDLSNGWYIYIMSALYLAVPAVTGQLVLGAKAGSAGLVKDAFSAVGNDGSQAAKTGAQHQVVNALTTNQKSLGQAAVAKAMRAGTGLKGQGPSLAAQSLQAGVDSANLGVENAALSGMKDFMQGKSSMARNSLDSFSRGTGLARAVAGGLDKTVGEPLLASKTPGGPGDSGGKQTAAGWTRGFIGSGADTAERAGMVALGREMDKRALEATARGQDIGWASRANDLNQNRLRDAGGKLSSAADYESQMAAWEAKNDFAAHASAMGGIAGMNAGSLAPHDKPQQMEQLAVSGMLDGWGVKDGKAAQNANNNASGAAWYSVDEGSDGLKQRIGTTMSDGQEWYGGFGIEQDYAANGGSFSMTGAVVRAGKEGVTGDNYMNQSERTAVVAGGKAGAKAVGEAGNAVFVESQRQVNKAVEGVQNWAKHIDGDGND